MMHQFVVVDSADYFVGISTINGPGILTIYPNPATSHFVINETFNSGSTLNLYDTYGRLLRKEKFLPGNRIFVEVGDIPKGMVIVEVVSGDKRYSGRVMVN